jgi:hypothetical protein
MGFAGEKSRTGTTGVQGRVHNPQAEALCYVDDHAQLTPYAQIVESSPPGNLDWTVGGLAGKDLKD